MGADEVIINDDNDDNDDIIVSMWYALHKFPDDDGGDYEDTASALLHLDLRWIEVPERINYIQAERYCTIAVCGSKFRTVSEVACRRQLYAQL